MSTLRLAFITLPLIAGMAMATAGCGVPLVVSGASYAADGGLLVSSQKTAGDHLVSMVSKQDCALWRVVKGRQICHERDGDTDPYKVDYGSPERQVAEDGVHYTPPLRAAQDAPATSWDATAYRPDPPAASTAAAPAATPAPVADPPAAQPAAAAPAPVSASPSKVAAAAPSPTKPAKPRSVRKPSRRPAAPAS